MSGIRKGTTTASDAPAEEPKYAEGQEVKYLDKSSIFRDARIVAVQDGTYTLQQFAVLLGTEKKMDMRSTFTVSEAKLEAWQVESATRAARNAKVRGDGQQLVAATVGSTRTDVANQTGRRNELGALNAPLPVYDNTMILYEYVEDDRGNKTCWDIRVVRRLESGNYIIQRNVTGMPVGNAKEVTAKQLHGWQMMRESIEAARPKASTTPNSQAAAKPVEAELTDEQSVAKLSDGLRELIIKFSTLTTPDERIAAYDSMVSSFTVESAQAMFGKNTGSNVRDRKGVLKKLSMEYGPDTLGRDPENKREEYTAISKLLNRTRELLDLD